MTWRRIYDLFLGLSVAALLIWCLLLSLALGELSLFAHEVVKSVKLQNTVNAAVLDILKQDRK